MLEFNMPHEILKFSGLSRGRLLSRSQLSCPMQLEASDGLGWGYPKFWVFEFCKPVSSML